jgi:hypothetical protein
MLAGDIADGNTVIVDKADKGIVFRKK